jgi:predicted nuclease with TOPRIM domain
MGESNEVIENGNESGMKGIGVILTIIALITGVAAIITPMNNRLETMEKSIGFMEIRNEKSIQQLDDKIQIEIDNIKESCQENNVINREHIEKHEGNNARMDERIKHLLEHVNSLERQTEKLQEQLYNIKKGR